MRDILKRFFVVLLLWHVSYGYDINNGCCNTLSTSEFDHAVLESEYWTTTDWYSGSPQQQIDAVKNDYPSSCVGAGVLFDPSGYVHQNGTRDNGNNTYRHTYELKKKTYYYNCDCGEPDSVPPLPDISPDHWVLISVDEVPVDWDKYSDSCKFDRVVTVNCESKHEYYYNDSCDIDFCKADYELHYNVGVGSDASTCEQTCYDNKFTCQDSYILSDMDLGDDGYKDYACCVQNPQATYNADGSTTTTTTHSNADGSTTTYQSTTKSDGSTVQTTTTYNTDGSVSTSTTTYNSDGSAVSTSSSATTATNADGSTTTTTTNADGSTTTTTTNADGSTTTTTANSDTNTTYSYSNSSSDISSSKTAKNTSEMNSKLDGLSNVLTNFSNQNHNDLFDIKNSIDTQTESINNLKSSIDGDEEQHNSYNNSLSSLVDLVNTTSNNFSNSYNSVKALIDGTSSPSINFEGTCNLNANFYGQSVNINDILDTPLTWFRPLILIFLNLAFFVTIFKVSIFIYKDILDDFKGVLNV